LITFFGRKNNTPVKFSTYILTFFLRATESFMRT